MFAQPNPSDACYFSIHKLCVCDMVEIVAWFGILRLFCIADVSHSVLCCSRSLPTQYGNHTRTFTGLRRLVIS